MKFPIKAGVIVSGILGGITGFLVINIYIWSWYIYLGGDLSYFFYTILIDLLLPVIIGGSVGLFLPSVLSTKPKTFSFLISAISTSFSPLGFGLERILLGNVVLIGNLTFNILEFYLITLISGLFIAFIILGAIALIKRLLRNRKRD